MANIGQVPNRPSGTATRSIAAILSDFDYITNDYNGNIDFNNLAASLRNGVLKLFTVADIKLKMLTNAASSASFGGSDQCNAVFAHGLGHAPTFAGIVGAKIDDGVDANCPCAAGVPTWDATNVNVRLTNSKGRTSLNFPLANIIVIG